MIDRETLELAAKAAGLRHIEYNNDYDGRFGLMLCDEIGRQTGDWNPLTDHGQLLDLAMACKIELMPMTNEICYAVKGAASFSFVAVNCQDFSALAKAVVIAASEMEKAKCRT